MIKSLRKPKAGHVIAGIVYFLPLEFSCDTRAWHSGITTLRNEGYYRDLLKEFIFLDRQSFPYSPLLERAFKNLIEARLLYIRSPEFKKFRKTEEGLKTLEEIVEKFNTEEKNKLKGMAGFLEDFLE